MAIERLQKILAQAGIASRRKAEEMIEQGLVTVNGAAAKLGDKADFERDHIKVDGTLLRKLEDPFYVVMNKPKGVISMMGDPEGRPTLADFLAKLKVRVNPIGRLDFNSEGLLLLTNDGALAEKIQKSDAFPRVYHVKVRGHITTEMIDRLGRGARVANKFVKPMSVRINEELNKKTKIEIAFLNAANVDVKGYFEEKGFLVEKITRTSIGHLTLHGLEPGKYRTVPKSKFEALVAQPELGVKALTLRHEKEREILPRDQRMRNVDEHGKVIPKVSPRAAATDDARPAGASAEKGLKRGIGAAATGKADRIVVRAKGDDAAPKKKNYSASVELPAFSKRGAFGARGPEGRPRVGAGSRPGSRPGSKPRFGARGAERPAPGARDGQPRFSARGAPRGDSSFSRGESRSSFGRGEGRGASRDSGNRGASRDSGNRGASRDSGNRGPRRDSDNRGAGRDSGGRPGRGDFRTGARGPRAGATDRGFRADTGGNTPRSSRPSARLNGRPGRPIARVKRRDP